MTLNPYPPGTTSQISYSVSLNSFTFAFGKSQQETFLYTVNNKSINPMTQHRDLGILMIFIGRSKHYEIITT